MRASLEQACGRGYALDTDETQVETPDNAPLPPAKCRNRDEKGEPESDAEDLHNLSINPKKARALK